mmetsp:Transcript_58099/g.115184  ORF Transcript_58099/g.115184 Transcript_58099/m.115184 type:complete len:631 (+) Transcript_58099:126-2018(+)
MLRKHKESVVTADMKPGKVTFYLPSKFLRTWLNERAAIKGFMLYTIFTALYLAHATLRCDWQFGAQTFDTVESVRKKLGVRAFDTITHIDQLVDFLDIDFDRLTTALAASCKDCEVALTDINGDLKDMDMAQFVCGDFASEVGTMDYPTRDCKTADAEYAERPSALKAPCCLNNTLVQASMSVMVWARFQPEFLEPDFLSPGPLSLADLLAIDNMLREGGPAFDRLPQSKKDLFVQTARHLPPGVKAAGAFLYLSHSVDEGFVVQVIFSRHQRMLGSERRATWRNKVNEPGIVVPLQTFWTHDYRSQHHALTLLKWVFWSWSLLHEILGYYSRNLTLSALAVELLHVYTVFFVFTTVSPVVAELTTAGLTLSQWTMWISINEAAMGLRCFVEGQHMMVGLKIVVLTVKTALYSLGTLISLTFFMSVIIGHIFGQLFGVVDHNLDPWTWGLARCMVQLVVPADLEHSHMVQDQTAALLFYYLCLFMFRLAFGSFVVAVLVAAFNKARGEIDQYEKHKTSCEAGFERRGRSVLVQENALASAKKKFRRFIGIVWYVLTWCDYGTFVPTMERHLLHLSMAKGDESGMRTMFPEHELAEEFGPQTAMHLVNDFAFEKTGTSDAKEDPQDEAFSL